LFGRSIFLLFSSLYTNYYLKNNLGSSQSSVDDPTEYAEIAKHLQRVLGVAPARTDQSAIILQLMTRVSSLESQVEALGSAMSSILARLGQDRSNLVVLRDEIEVEDEIEGEDEIEDEDEEEADLANL
jgi:hypothetical protein